MNKNIFQIVQIFAQWTNGREHEYIIIDEWFYYIF